MGVHWAAELAESLANRSVADGGPIDIEVLDLRTLVPLDLEAVVASVKKTGKALVLHEDTLTGGFGGELSALIMEHCFDHLDAPVVRVASWDTPVPFAVPLEKGFLPKERLWEAVERLGAY
jgi:2-oxoisovalerate dehydrogenase E1 component